VWHGTDPFLLKGHEWHDKDPSLLKGPDAEHRALGFTGNGDVSISEKEILEWDVKQ
jgi:hypothetical protein